MQIQDSNRGDVPGSKSRHPVAPKGSSDRRPRVPTPAPPPPTEDALDAPLPPTDDTPTIISRNVPSAAVSVPSAAGEPETGIRGRRLAHFELLEPVGVGGMAAVIRARDTQLDRFVALKILPPDMASDDENVRRFHQEARSAAKLDHENVARVFFCGEDQRLHFIAFEFVEGENLRTILERRGRLPVAEALNYVIQVAAGLAHASARGVVHRDVKPSNIIITPTGRAKLVDMGLARSMERGNVELTQSGVTLGTFDYISPEQALEPREADVRSDVYSLGCTLYHVLTGRTPTPEGTAAKKLHHHQHVNPVDPRHYVPDLPFDVVQILDRMMAKKPRDRFQTPEELVQQLLLAARALGGHSDVPEGVLSVETAVPAPLGRPLLWAGLAAIAVIALVFVLDPLSNSSQTPDTPVTPRHADGGNPLPRKDGPPVVKEGDKQPPIRPIDVTPDENVYRWTDQSTADHLAKWLKAREGVDRIELRLAGDVVLTAPTEASNTPPALLVKAKHAIIKPLTPESRPTIRLHYGVAAAKQLVALEVDSPRSQIEGLRFMLDDTGSDVGMIGLRLQPGKHEVKRCEFVQAQVPLAARERRVASLVTEVGRGRSAEVSVTECIFVGFASWGEPPNEATLTGIDKGGQNAIVRRGAVKLDVTGCFFGPHAAAIRLEGDGGTQADKVEVGVRHCTVLLPPGRSSAFEFPADATGKTHLDVAHSLFSRLDVPSTDPDGAVLLRQAGRRESVWYDGLDNVYHDLDGYRAVADDWRKAGWGAFRNEEDAKRDTSRIVLSSPWASSSKEFLDSLEARRFLTALRLTPRLAALRKASGQPNAAGDYVGAETVLGDRLVRLVEDRTVAPPRRVLLVESNALTDDANGVYPDLGSAVQKARPGDVIQVRHDGKLEMKPIALTDKAASDVTIRPARRFEPLLALHPETTGESEASFFRVQDGTLRLEGLKFKVAPPSKAGFKLVSLVTFTGDGHCVVNDCAATLERTKETPAVLATLAGRPDKEMKANMTPARNKEQGPLLVIENSFIRGEGDLFSTTTSKPCQVDFKNSVAALTGSLASVVVPGGSEVPLDAHKVAINLTQSTTYLGGNLVKLVVKDDPRGVVPVECKAGKCLFVAAGGKALIQLDGADTDEKSIRDKFRWIKEADNGYGGYSTMVLSLTPTNDAMATRLDMAKWKADYCGGEEGPDGAKFDQATDVSRTQVPVTAFKQPQEFATFGADVAKLSRRTGQ